MTHPGRLHDGELPAEAGHKPDETRRIQSRFLAF
jgi:hypothetical protein